MLKKLIVLFALVLVIGQADAQKKYTRKIKVQTDDDGEVEEVITTESEEDADDEEELTEITINTKPIGKYLEARRKKKNALKFEPMAFIGWNGMDVDNYEANVLGNIKDFSDMNMKAFSSWYVAAFPIGVKINLYQQKFNLITGAGFQFYNYKFSDSVVFSTTTPYYVDHYSPVHLRKTKLGSSYLTLPLMFEYNSERKGVSNFSVAAGMLFGYRMKTWTKMKLDNGDKFHGPEGNYNFNNFVYSVAFMVGFRDVKLFGTYMLTPLHRPNQGYNVNMYPFSFGLQI